MCPFQINVANFWISTHQSRAADFALFRIETNPAATNGGQEGGGDGDDDIWGMEGGGGGGARAEAATAAAAARKIEVASECEKP